MPRIAIMQGRLLQTSGGCIQCFPREGWETEFALAAEAELDAIEWIYDLPSEEINPVVTDVGIDRIRAHAKRFSVAVVSLCADYFMERRLVGEHAGVVRESVDKLLWLIERCARLRITRVVLPFVDNSSINTHRQQADTIVVLNEVFPVARDNGVEIHLETSLPPAPFARLLDELPPSTFKANYDCGNSASLGYNFRHELAAYGERIGSVHIKDRVRGGGTVPLGHGDADIPGFLEGLCRLGYRSDFVLQVARGPSGQELEWAKHNRALVLSYLEQAVGTKLTSR